MLETNQGFTDCSLAHAQLAGDVQLTEGIAGPSTWWRSGSLFGSLWRGI